jgi:hypothetical protein
MRWNIILKNEFGNFYEGIIKTITIFQKVSSHLTSEFDFSAKHIESLIGLGILERTPSEQLVFHHSQLLTFFNSLYFSNGIDLSTAEKISALIETNNLAEIYPVQYFVSKNTLSPNDNNILRFGVDCLLSDDINRELTPMFSMHLYKSLKLVNSKDDSIPLIKAYTKICDNVKMYVHFSKAMELFSEAYYDRFKNYKNYTTLGDDYYYFIFRYVEKSFVLFVYFGF